MDVNQSRRRLLKSALAGAFSGAGASKRVYTHPESTRDRLAGLFQGIAIPPGVRPLEASLARLSDGRYWLLFGHEKSLAFKSSSDCGRTWEATSLVATVDATPVTLFRQEANASLFHLPSGDLGMVYGGRPSRPGRFGTLQFRKSKDKGRTWSLPEMVDPHFAVCHIMCARVLRTGRIVVPVFKWYSPDAGDNSAQTGRGFSVSWVIYSDDEGLSWRRSLSELFVSIDQGRQGVYSFEEPCLEELRDGRLLMFGRTELGRFYQSLSGDGGVTWSRPEPTALAAAYAPPMIVRIPETGDLLLVWNQASTEEIVSGIPRHRLSTAVSKDEGQTWTHFHNLESLDHRSMIRPPSTVQVYRRKGSRDVNKSRQPTDFKRYSLVPGFLSVSYPSVVVRKSEVAIAYLYGNGPDEGEKGFATKIKILSVKSLYGERGSPSNS